jgi:transposase
VRVGIEATGHSRWFEPLLGELNYELWVGDPAQIRGKRVRKQRNDRFDAQHILKLMLENNFPRIWVPTPENRDVRQLVMHRHRLVGMRTRVMNQLQAIAMNEGVRRKRGLWSEKGRAQLKSLRLPPWTTRRRQELLDLLDRFDPNIDQLSQAIEQEAERIPEVQRLQSHPGVGPITALAFVLVLGTPDRFRCGKQVASYLGLIPCEDSSADSWRLGHISKQGNALLRHLLGQAAQRRQACFFTGTESLNQFVVKTTRLWLCFLQCIGPEVWSGHRPAYRNLARGFGGARRSLRAVGLQLSERRS